MDALRQTIKTSALIFMILIGATIFGYYMALSKIPQQVVAVVTELNLNRWVVIVGIVVAYFVVSMFMDELPLLLLTLQLTFPLITALGFDPIWFGVMSMLMVSMGLVFPPVGMIAFVVSSSGNVGLMKVYTGTSILMIAIVLTTDPHHGVPPDRALAPQHHAVTKLCLRRPPPDGVRPSQGAASARPRWRQTPPAFVHRAAPGPPANRRRLRRPSRIRPIVGLRSRSSG